jgi:hypothetical protein
LNAAPLSTRDRRGAIAAGRIDAKLQHARPSDAAAEILYNPPEQIYLVNFMGLLPNIAI